MSPPFLMITANPQTFSHAYAAPYYTNPLSLIFPLSLSYYYFSSSNKPAYANVSYAYPSQGHFPRHHSCKCHYWTHRGGGKCSILNYYFTQIRLDFFLFMCSLSIVSSVHETLGTGLCYKRRIRVGC